MKGKTANITLFDEACFVFDKKYYYASVSLLTLFIDTRQQFVCQSYKSTSRQTKLRTSRILLGSPIGLPLFLIYCCGWWGFRGHGGSGVSMYSVYAFVGFFNSNWRLRHSLAFRQVCLQCLSYFLLSKSLSTFFLHSLDMGRAARAQQTASLTAS